MAAAFNVSEETLRGDLNVLWMCGMPGLMPGDLIEIDMDGRPSEDTIGLLARDTCVLSLKQTSGGRDLLALVGDRLSAS